MACSTSLLLHLQPPNSEFSSTHTLHIIKNPYHILTTSYLKKTLKFKSSTKSRISFALTESDSSSIPFQPDPQILLQELAVSIVSSYVTSRTASDSFVLPADYFSQLPRDLRLDLNDAAFDLSNGPVKDECGQELGEVLLNISQAWERADTSTSAALLSKLPKLASSLSDNNRAALGKRLVSAGRRFQSMGQYGQGELQMIANAMIKTGKLLSESQVSQVTNEEPKKEAKMLKFGDLQVELTPEKAYTGAVIGFVFGILSWQLSQGVQNIPESSLQYANDNALLLAKSLRGALLALCYSSTVLSAFATVGLVLYGGQLKPKEK